MLKLAFDDTLKSGIRPAVKVAVYAAPMACMFGSLIFTFQFGMYAADMFGIPEGAPVKDQENGVLWMVLMFCVLFGFAFIGYVLGWLLNALASMLFLGWPLAKVIAVYGRSEIPGSWCEAPEEY